jgi:hypothetical protein
VPKYRKAFNTGRWGRLQPTQLAAQESSKTQP